MLEPVPGNEGALLASLRVGAISVANQQLGIALALGCERIICISAGLSPEVLAVQHRSERVGAQFHLVASARAMVGTVTAVDEVFVFADGLFASASQAKELLDAGPAVLVQPAEQGLTAGFERVDAVHAAAGAMRLPGRLIEQLADLPIDVDAVSALQRIALQAGLSRKSLAGPGSEAAIWTLLKSEDEAHALEPIWIRQRIQDDEPGNAARGIARYAVQAMGSALLHAGRGAGSVAIAATVLVLLGLGAGWFGLVPLGLSACGFGWIVREAAVLLARIESETVQPRPKLASRVVFGWMVDLSLVALAGWGSVVSVGEQPFARYFGPAMLVALLRILPRVIAGRWTAWMGDRALVAAGLGLVVGAGAGDIAVKLAALSLALAGILLPRGELRLTRP